MTIRPFRHLLIFIHSLGCGGAERVAANMANHWAERDLRVTVVTLTPDARDFYDLHPKVRRVVLNKDYASRNPLAAVFNNWSQVRALRQVLRKEKPDVALAMMSKANVWLALAASGLSDVVCVGSEHIHPPEYPLGGIWEFLRSRLYGRLAAVTALTEQSADWLRRKTSAVHIEVIPNAAPWPLPVLQPYLAPPRRENERILLAVGRLCEQKGFDILIRVFARLANDFPRWTLVIAGEGPLRTSLQTQIDSTEYADRMLLAGRVGNLGQWYEAAHVYVMSSRFEGFGNTLAEAMTYGLPVVSFDCDTGPRDIVSHEVDGLLVPAGSGAALELALRRVMGDDAFRHRLSAQALKARERYSLKAIASRWEALFESLRKQPT